MARPDQPNIFNTPTQADLFGPAAAPAYRPDLNKVRARLDKILTEARAAKSVPWQPIQLSLYRTIFPQMTRWLPDEEARQLRLAFDAELKRLGEAV